MDHVFYRPIYNVYDNEGQKMTLGIIIGIFIGAAIGVIGAGMLASASSNSEEDD